MTHYHYLIIGNSAAGIGAVEAIREVDRERSVAIISDERYHTHSRALIAFYLMGRLTSEGMNYRPRDFYQRHGVETLLGHKAVQLNPEARRVTLEDGTEVSYDQLLLATGGKAIVPPLPGAKLEGVFTFQSVADVEAVKAALTHCQKAVVIGGGLIGMQAAEALCELGRQVTVVELLPRILAPVLDETASTYTADLFAKRGVRIVTGTGVSEILPKPGEPGRAGGVKLSTGEEIPADLVIMSVGVAPRADLAKSAGIQVNRGIVVDRAGATSAAGVYAAGDCAEGFDRMTGQVKPMPILPRAYTGGRIAGQNMAGRQTTSAGDLAMNASHFFGFPSMSAGIHDTTAPGVPAADYEVITSARLSDEGYYQKIILRDERIVGFVLMGAAVDRAGILTGLMKEAYPISDFRDKLIHHRALISLPDELRRRRLQGR
ncbi:MAG TPA: FAD-dependent oxidoreductase [Symbiobacteriaceae bacterium]|nr:FAD-dependent oxidoreductase [Symbiobacteriaceae bacterium]